MIKRVIIFCCLSLILGTSIEALEEKGKELSERIYRLEETMWSFHHKTEDHPIEIRILAPGFDDRTLDYALVCHVVKVIEQQGHFNLLSLDLSHNKELFPELRKKWKIVDITSQWYAELNGFFKNNFNPQNVRIIQIESTSFLRKTLNSIKHWFAKKQEDISLPTHLEMAWDEKNLSIITLEKGLFEDPFTLLATKALQTDETPFIAEKECRGTYQFVLQDDKLKLEPIDEKSTSSRSAVIEAIKAYRTYLKRAFAWRILDGEENLFRQGLSEYNRIFFDKNCREEQLFGYLRCSLGIDFDDMIERGKPLLPDHVFKCNISIQNIEMLQVESLFLRVTEKLKKSSFGEDTLLSTPVDFFHFLEKLQLTSYFSLKEIKGIHHSFKKFAGLKQLTSKNFKEYLHTFAFVRDYRFPGYGEKIRDLTPQAFHQLMEILFVDTGLVDAPLVKSPFFEKFFTGRKIMHLGICGYKTMGNKKEYDPCRNLFELLHLYPLLGQSDEPFLYEVLASVIVKKSLWSHYPSRFSASSSSTGHAHERRVGRLIPFPSHRGEKRWSYVDGLLNDDRGDFNYVLIPACKGYVETLGQNPIVNKRSPLIKLYRNTASDSEAESSLDSLMADANPTKIGSLDFNAGDEYESVYFERCTIPLWIGYLIVGEVDKAVDSFSIFYPLKQKISQNIHTKEDKLNLLLELMVWQKFQIAPQDPVLLEKEMRVLLTNFIQKVGSDWFDYYLLESMHGMEWEKRKVAQDIYFVGHSLGGTLAQSGLYHFGPEQERIPLYGCNYHCVVYDPSGVSEQEASGFLNFGRKHTDLLQCFKQEWKIQYQFEYRDLVPQGGNSFLGACGYNLPQDSLWLKIAASICKPLDASQDIVITTTPVHGRRFAQAKIGIDYDRSSLQITELDELKSDWILSEDLREKFGYKWTIPRVSETLRRTLPGTFAFAYFWTKKSALSLMSPKRTEADKDGVIFCTYQGRGALRGYLYEVTYAHDLDKLLKNNFSTKNSTENILH